MEQTDAATTRTRAYRLLEELLIRAGHGPLDIYVLTHRRDERSWRWITRRLKTDTGETVTPESLADWFRDQDPAAEQPEQVA